jgi:glycosyltransferase involved in cell wall biosynthesis
MTLHNYRLTCINAQLLRNGHPCQLCVGSHPWRGVQFRCYRNSYLASAAAAITLSLNRTLGTHEKGVNRFLVFTPFQRDLMIEAGIRPEKLELVPNFVADPGPRRWEPGASDIMLYVGRLSPEKGVDRLIDAWARVMPAEMRLVVVGDGQLRSTLAERRVPGVEFRGRIAAEEVRALMLEARALLFPTIWYEGQPMVLLEALASGLPVVAPRIGAVAHTMDEAALWVEDAGWEIALKEVCALSDARLSLLSRAGRQRYDNEFTPAKALSRLTEVYWNVLEE